MANDLGPAPAPRWRTRVRDRYAAAATVGWMKVRDFGIVNHRSAPRLGFAAFGDSSFLGFPPGVLHGLQSVTVGRHTLIERNVTLCAGYPGETGLPADTLTIGDRCVIGRGSSINAHRSIVIEDDVWLGPDVFVVDTNHGTDDPDVPIGIQIGDSIPVRLGRGCWIGRGAVILPGVQVGRNAVVGAGAVVTHSVPDHGVAVGVPARIHTR